MYLINFVRKRKTLLLSGFSKVKTRQILKTELAGERKRIYTRIMKIYTRTMITNRLAHQTEERERERYFSFFFLVGCKAVENSCLLLQVGGFYFLCFVQGISAVTDSHKNDYNNNTTKLKFSRNGLKGATVHTFVCFIPHLDLI